MTKTVRDTEIVLSAIEGFDEKDPSSIKFSEKYSLNTFQKNSDEIVLGINEDFYFKNVDDEIMNLVKRNIEHLESRGIKIEQVDIPTLEHAEYALTITDMSEASTVHYQNLVERSADFGEDVRPILELGIAPSAVEYLQAQQIRRQLKLEFKQAFESVDALIAPTMPIMVPNIGEDQAIMNGTKVDLFDYALRLTSPANFTGLPSLSVPGGFINGMPVGIQLIGPAFKESNILALGKLIETYQPPTFPREFS